MLITHFDRAHAHGYPVSIAYSADVPFSFAGHRDEKLAPTYCMKVRLQNGELSAEDFAKEYLALLTTRGVTPEGVLAKHTDHAVLVCGKDDLHGPILAQWLSDGGLKINQDF